MSRSSRDVHYDKEQEKNDQSFYFGSVTYDDVLKKIIALDTAKASQQSALPAKTLKQNSDYFAVVYFNENINQVNLKINIPVGFEIS